MTTYGISDRWFVNAFNDVDPIQGIPFSWKVTLSRVCKQAVPMTMSRRSEGTIWFEWVLWQTKDSGSSIFHDFSHSNYGSMVVVQVTKIAMATVIYFPHKIRVVFCNSVGFFLLNIITMIIGMETEGVRQQFQTFGTSTGEEDGILFRACVEMLENSEKRILCWKTWDFPMGRWYKFTAFSDHPRLFIR